MPKYGEMIVNKVVTIEKNRQNHRDVGDKNQLAICVIESQRRKIEEQIDISARALIDDEVRLANAGEKGGLGRKAKIKEKDDELMPDLKKCMDSLKARKIRTSVAAIESEWARQKRLNLITIECPKIGKIRKLVNSLS